MHFQNILSGRNGISEKLAKYITDVHTNISYDWLLKGTETIHSINNFTLTSNTILKN